MQLKRRYKNVIKRFLAYARYIEKSHLIKKNGKWMMKPQYETLIFDAMNLDINNTCNLRCRFCFNMFDEEPCYMSEDIFRKVLSLFPLIRSMKQGGEGVFFSCIYEPTMSLHFLDFLKLIPQEGREKVFFTSNFCKPFTEEEFRSILSANLHHINISVETFRAERYKEICSSMQFDNFYRNMEILSSVYGKMHDYRPKLYYISMILKANRDELASIVRFCSEKLHADHHFLRTPYISEKDNNVAWNKEQLMDADECAHVRQELESLNLPIGLDIHSKEELTNNGTVAFIEPEQTEQAAKLSRLLEEIRLCMDPQFLFMRFHASGTCTFHIVNEVCSISEIEDTVSYYEQKLYALYRRRARAFLCPNEILNTCLDFGASNVREVSMRILFEKILENPVYLFLQGYIYLSSAFEEEMLLLLTDRKIGQTFFTLERVCPEHIKEPEKHSYGFVVCLDYGIVTDNLTDLEFLFVRKRDLKPMYFYHCPFGILCGKKEL